MSANNKISLALIRTTATHHCRALLPRITTLHPGLCVLHSIVVVLQASDACVFVHPDADVMQYAPAFGKARFAFSFGEVVVRVCCLSLYSFVWQEHVLSRLEAFVLDAWSQMDSLVGFSLGVGGN